jgi:DNA invertase Pin-like site-specific DNA recombinase
MKKVVIYTRVSMEEQSCEIQLAELRKYAADRNWQVIEEYVDKVTGDVKGRIKRGERFRYDDLMDDAQKGLFQAVLVWKFDRFARSLIHLVTALEKFQTLGIDFISTTQNIDTTTPAGKLFFSMLAAFAEFERSIIIERTRAGRELVLKTGYNSKGEPSRIGRPEGVGLIKKNAVLRRYQNWESLPEIVEREQVALSTIYSLIKRSLVQCTHGKYRCESCGCTLRVPLRIVTSGSKSRLGAR